MNKSLSKSKYLSGLQCTKRLWNETNYPARKAAVSIIQQRIFEQGKEVGAEAHAHFTDGIEMGNNPIIALQQTTKAIEQGDTCLFEATFKFNDVMVRCDILKKEGSAWQIIEIKSSAVNSFKKKKSELLC